MTILARMVFSIAEWFFRTTNIYRPSRVFDLIGSRAFPSAQYSWIKNQYDAKLFLSPHFHIDRNIILFGCYDRELHLLLNKRCTSSMVCFDIGANLGEVTLHMGKMVGSGGKVFAVDPNPNAFRRLKEHVKANNLESVVECLSVALSNHSGELELSFPDESAENQGLGSVVNVDQPGVSRKQTVKTLTIDGIVAQYSLKKVDMIKIDTQGAEPLILEGAKETLKAYMPDIIMEISPTDLKFLGLTSVDLIKRLEGYGYTMYEFKNGVLTSPITSSSISPDYAVENIYCTVGKRN